jgi:hypothetical protein
LPYREARCLSFPLIILSTQLQTTRNIATGYTGTVHFKSTDGKASLPSNYTFKASDKGTHTFSGVVLKTRGKQSITATDTLFSTLTGSVSLNVS